MNRHSVLAWSLFALAGCAAAGEQSVSRPSPAATAQISQELLVEITREISSDAYEGREPGTAGEERTLTFLVGKFAAAGLQPGNNGSWFQDVPLVEIAASNVTPLHIGGPAADLRFNYGTDWVGFTYREVPRTSLEDSEIVFVGYGINAPEKGWNDYAGIDMRGKTALILVNDPDYESDALEGPFNGRAMTYYGRWTYKFEEAARQGAAAALVVHDTYPAAYGWNVVESSWTGPQLYAQRSDGGASQTTMNGWVQLPVAEAIASAGGQDFAALTHAAKHAGFKPVPLGLTVSASFENSVRKFESRNLIGILPGSSRPDEYVLYTAHWDHLGHCTPNAAGDDICNGAVDNATGTAGLVALAQAHVAAGPAERSLVFLSVTAEEAGLLGSEYYGANPVFPLAQTAGGLNMDGSLMQGPARDITVIGGGKSELDTYLGNALSEMGLAQSPDRAPQAGLYYRSDHFSLAKRGVPMFNLRSGRDLVEGGSEAGEATAANYRANLYHAPDDEFDPDWKWGGLVQDLQLFYRIARMMAEDTAWPNWYEGDEFRAIRDTSCAPEGGC